jgi:1-acyl-sn-glycerol-3-phosphate acyltransferase
MEGDRHVLRSVTDEIMVALQRMGAQEYEDVYASTVKSRATAAAAGTRPSSTQPAS